eukprot:GHUV01035344.1.p1 GENE.GHUV01035344.1~~GHUV01035344.1.p1  ORF type:complete len:161 (-),score=36.04 GHUV01035344.1:822-1304(-)
MVAALPCEHNASSFPVIQTTVKRYSPNWCCCTDCTLQLLQEFLHVNGPVLQLPKNITSISTATTIIHLAAPELQIILDPLLYLRLLPHSQGIPKLIHMTMKDKNQLAPHQILSVLSWGRFNKGYTLLLYDNDDIERYMQQYFPGFMPSECGTCRACGRQC